MIIYQFSCACFRARYSIWVRIFGSFISFESAFIVPQHKEIASICWGTFCLTCWSVSNKIVDWIAKILSRIFNSLFKTIYDWCNWNFQKLENTLLPLSFYLPNLKTINYNTDYLLQQFLLKCEVVKLENHLQIVREKWNCIIF